MHEELARLVRWFRHSSPYIHAHRGRTFVVSFGGEALEDAGAAGLVHDLALLNGLGVRLVLVPGARPQIERRLRARGAEIRYVNGLRVTDNDALDCVQDAVGSVRLQLEALLSMGLANSPMAGVRIRAAAGNFVTARPLGIRDGVDYLHTGEVRRVDAEAIGQRLDDGDVTVVTPLGVSPTGEMFNLYAEDVALAVARVIGADKLLYLHEGRGLTDEDGAPVGELTLDEARRRVAAEPPEAEGLGRQLARAVEACQSGVPRVHLVERRTDGALLMELFTRDGVGTLVTARSFERLRRATVDDVGGILALIEPLERDGTLVRRSRELLETEIGRFTVMEREGTVVACAALYPMADAPMAELACVAVHPEYRGGHRGARLLERLEREAREAGCERVFVLTTRTAHWFLEHGFEPASLEDLPVARRALYNLKRGSKMYWKAV